MSSLNLQWLRDNFSSNPIVLFDIGCANVNGDTLRIKQVLPNAKIYAFECESRWLEDNLAAAKQYNINYYHVAMSNRKGQELFTPSSTFNGMPWEFSGHLSDVENNANSDQLRWGQSYVVQTTTLNDFCHEHNVFPDFIHIDAEGAEYKIFLELDKNIRPKAIWAEVTEYHNNELDLLLERYGYVKSYTDNVDALYVLPNCGLTDYTCLSSEQETQLEYQILCQIWLERYSSVRGDSWPILETVDQFNTLPQWIQDECINLFNLSLPK